MRICWDNLNDLRLSKRGNLRYKGTTYIEKDSCLNCNQAFLTKKAEDGDFCCISCATTGEFNGYYNHRNVDIPRDVLDSMYTRQEKSINEMADLLGCGKSTVYRRLKECDIKIRPASLRISLNNAKNCRSAPRKNFGRGNGAYYDTPYGKRVYMRSSWEIKVADYLTEIGEPWFYEPTVLRLREDTFYIPDFYLPDKEKYIEVKGWKTERTMKKFNLAKEIYDIDLWDKHKLKSLGIIGG